MKYIANALLLIGFLIGIASLLFGINTKKCNSQWEDSGMNHRYAIFSGCQIQKQDKTWIPADAYREIAK